MTKEINMKKCYFIFLTFLLGGSSLFAQPQLTLRLTKPRDTLVVVNFLKYDVEVKSSLPGYFAKTLQANLYYTPAVIGTTLAVDRCGISSYQLAFSGDAYNLVFSISSGLLNVAIPAVTSGVWPWGTDPISWYFCEVPTSWTKLCSIRIRILDQSQGSAGIFMSRATMGLQEFYQNPAGTGGFNFTVINPSSYDTTQSLRDIYVGRIYNSISGWTQARTPPTVDWTVPVNTSVWDTSSSAPTINSAAQMAALRIHSGARLKILPGGQVTCTGATEINEPKGLWIASDATGTGSFIDNGTITYNSGSALAEKYFVPDQWHGYYPPFQSILTHEYKGYFMKYYYESVTHQWRYVINQTLDSTLNNNALKSGFMMWSSSTTTNTTPIRPRGLLNTGPVSMQLSRTNGYIPWQGTTDNDGWNFIGNPYPSAIDVTLLTPTNVTTNYYFWSNSYGNYVTYPTVGGPYGSHTKYAPASQGFFVHVPTGNGAAVGTLAFTNAARVHNTETYLKEDGVDFVKLTATNSVNSYADICTVHFQENSTLGFDENVDAEKLAGLTEAPQIYFPLEDGKNATINVQPWTGINQVVPVGLTFSQNATCTITASNLESFRSGTRVYLEDGRDASMNELTVNPVYTFTSSPTDNPNRFALHFYNPTFGIDNKNVAGMQIYSFEDYVYVRNLVKGTTRGTIQIYDMLGREVLHGNLKDMELNKFLPGVNEGYYMVRVVTADNSYSQKVYLK